MAHTKHIPFYLTREAHLLGVFGNLSTQIYACSLNQDEKTCDTSVFIFPLKKKIMGIFS